MSNGSRNLPSKIERIQTIQQIFERWGTMSREQIEQHLESRWEIDAPANRRTIYRDLDALVKMGILGIQYFDSDGSEILDASGEIARGSTAKWTLRTASESQIDGLKRLRDLGGDFIVSSRLRDAFSFASSLSKNRGDYSIFFELGSELISLNVKGGELPLKILIGRSSKNNLAEILGEFEETFGKRVAFLSLPGSTLSALESVTKPGHCSIELTRVGSILVQDFHSKNGTSVAVLPVDVTESDLRRSINQAATLTTPWIQNTIEAAKAFEQLLSEPRSFVAPILVRASDQVHFVVTKI